MNSNNSAAPVIIKAKILSEPPLEKVNKNLGVTKEILKFDEDA